MRATPFRTYKGGVNVIDEHLAYSLVDRAEDEVISAMEKLEELRKKGYTFESECFEKTDEAVLELTKERKAAKRKLKP